MKIACFIPLTVSWVEENPKSFWEPRNVLTERQLCGNYFVPRCRPRAAWRHFPCTARNTAQQKSNYRLIYLSNYNLTVVFLSTGKKKRQTPERNIDTLYHNSLKLLYTSVYDQVIFISMLKHFLFFFFFFLILLTQSPLTECGWKSVWWG